MSGYNRYATKFDNGALLMAALTAMGCHPEQQHQSLKNTYGERGAVDIRIPKAHLPDEISYPGDIGFAKDRDGTYSLVASDLYSDHRTRFLGRVGQEYNIARQTQAAEEQGLILSERHEEQTETGPRVQLSFIRR